eukprot:1072086-Amphidinium_carterae.1
MAAAEANFVVLLDDIDPNIVTTDCHPAFRRARRRLLAKLRPHHVNKTPIVRSTNDLHKSYTWLGKNGSRTCAVSS